MLQNVTNKKKRTKRKQKWSAAVGNLIRDVGLDPRRGGRLKATYLLENAEVETGESRDNSEDINIYR